MTIHQKKMHFSIKKEQLVLLAYERNKDALFRLGIPFKLIDRLLENVNKTFSYRGKWNYHFLMGIFFVENDNIKGVQHFFSLQTYSPNKKK